MMTEGKKLIKTNQEMIDVRPNCRSCIQLVLSISFFKN